MHRFKLAVLTAFTALALFLFSGLFQTLSFAQTPAGGTVVTSTASPAAVGVGIVGTIIAVLAVFNGAMSLVTQGFALLHKSEPGFLQKLGTIGLAISQFLTANTSTPALSKPGPATS